MSGRSRALIHSCASASEPAATARALQRPRKRSLRAWRERRAKRRRAGGARHASSSSQALAAVSARVSFRWSASRCAVSLSRAAASAGDVVTEGRRERERDGAVTEERAAVVAAAAAAPRRAMRTAAAAATAGSRGVHRRRCFEAAALPSSAPSFSFSPSISFSSPSPPVPEKGSDRAAEAPAVLMAGGRRFGGRRRQQVPGSGGRAGVWWCRGRVKF
jgi:hypothetical protein